MERSIENLVIKYNNLINSDFVVFNAVKEMKKIMGVYVIYSPEGEILYIGNTNNFNVRFGTDMRHESTHTLIRKLLKLGVHADRPAAAVYFINHYKYKIEICQTKREAEALEHLAIWLLNPKYNSHPLPITN